MLRVASRFAARVASGAAPRLAPVGVAVRHLGLKTLAATAPCNVRASRVEMAAPAAEASAPVAAGKVSQVIGAVVDVQFGMSFCSGSEWLLWPTINEGSHWFLVNI